MLFYVLFVCVFVVLLFCILSWSKMFLALLLTIKTLKFVFSLSTKRVHRELMLLFRVLGAISISKCRLAGEGILIVEISRSYRHHCIINIGDRAFHIEMGTWPFCQFYSTTSRKLYEESQISRWQCQMECLQRKPDKSQSDPHWRPLSFNFVMTTSRHRHASRISDLGEAKPPVTS